MTSAGTASEIDLCLFRWSALSTAPRSPQRLARRMVVPPHRSGGQAQYVEAADGPPRVAPLGRDRLARHTARTAGLGSVRLAVAPTCHARTFARRFRPETGTTPQRWLTGQRILLAQQLLEETDETVETIADRAGFGNATALRHHFRSWRGTTPHAYRRLFRGDSISASV